MCGKDCCIVGEWGKAVEDIFEISLGSVRKRSIVWFVEARTSGKGEIETDSVTFSEKLFCGWVVEQEAV